MKLSPVFPPHIKPVHAGVYMVSNFDDGFKNIAGDMPTDPLWARFDGEVWGCHYGSKQEAETSPMDAFYADQKKYWRGVI